MSATLYDVPSVPPSAIAGVSLSFTVGGESCNATTNPSGTASCSPDPGPGNYTLTASFSGNNLFTKAAALDFSVAGPQSVQAQPPSPAAAPALGSAAQGLLMALSAWIDLAALRRRR